MKLLLRFLIPIFIISLFLISCEESDKFSSDPNLKLEFSSDTLRFDSVFTTIASPMQEMRVRNKNNNSISFESIELMNPEKSGFRINVKGLAGSKFENVDLLRRDSMYIFVDAKPNALNGKNALVRDSICFKWNGNTQYVQLGGYGVDVNIWDDKVISSDTHFSSEKGYYIKGTLTVNEGVTLSVQEGTTFYMDQKSSVVINGTIVAEGSFKKPITFRGHRFDFIERNIPYDNASDQWEGITVGENSYNNALTNVRIRNSRKGIEFLKSKPSQQKATLTNTIIHNTSNFGLRAINCKIDAINCQITNSKGRLLDLKGGSYTFLHSTIANYYTWHARTYSSVGLEEVFESVTYPFIKCEFKNSLIVGTMREELSMMTNNTSSFLFDNCIIQAYGKNDSPIFANIIWNINSPFLFKDLNSSGRFYYSFELLDDSPARNAANVSYAQQAPTDLRGKTRLGDGKPDIGCYEWGY